MKVKLCIIDKVIVKLAWILGNLSFAMGQFIHKKYDPKHTYNTHTYNGKNVAKLFLATKRSPNKGSFFLLYFHRGCFY